MCAFFLFVCLFCLLFLIISILLHLNEDSKVDLGLANDLADLNDLNDQAVTFHPFSISLFLYIPNSVFPAPVAQNFLTKQQNPVVKLTSNTDL